MEISGQTGTSMHIYEASNGVWHIERVSPDNPFVNLIVSTSLTDLGEDFDWDDAEYVHDHLEDDGYREYDC